MVFRICEAFQALAAAVGGMQGHFQQKPRKGETKSMDMKKRDFLSLAAGVGAAAGIAAAAGKAEAQPRRPNLNGPIDVNQRGMVSQNVQPSTVDLNYKPRRINKAIELWEDGQPIYYNGSGLGPGVDPYAQGVKMARTW